MRKGKGKSWMKDRGNRYTGLTWGMVMWISTKVTTKSVIVSFCYKLPTLKVTHTHEITHTYINTMRMPKCNAMHVSICVCG